MSFMKSLYHVLNLDVFRCLYSNSFGSLLPSPPLSFPTDSHSCVVYVCYEFMSAHFHLRDVSFAHTNGIFFILQLLSNLKVSPRSRPCHHIYKPNTNRFLAKYAMIV